jgi:quinol monooxygenase YgiN
MSVTMVRQKVKAGSVEEAEAAVRDWFAALDRERPEGLRYASTRVDGSTFVILTELADGSEDPRQAIPEFRRFLEQLKELVDGPPVIEQLDVVGSYNLFGTQDLESSVR